MFSAQRMSWRAFHLRRQGVEPSGTAISAVSARPPSHNQQRPGQGAAEAPPPPPPALPPPPRHARRSPYPLQDHAGREYVRANLNAASVIWVSLFLFLCYIFVQSWMRAIKDGDFRSLGVSIVLLLLIAYACCRRKMTINSDMDLYDSAGNIPNMNVLESVPRGVSQATLDQLKSFTVKSSGSARLQDSSSAPVRAPSSTVDPAGEDPEQEAYRAGGGDSDLELGSHERACAICLCEYSVGDTVCTLGCSHCFHKACVYEWLSQATVCPYCKRCVQESILSYQ